MSKKLTDQQYVQRHGLVCPFRHGDDLDTRSPVTLETDLATREIRCNNCGRVWDDVFILSGYREVDEPPAWSVSGIRVQSAESVRGPFPQ